MAATVTVGLDIGQTRDPTALAVVESEPAQTGRFHCPVRHTWEHDARCVPVLEDHFQVRSVGRLALGTRYPAVVERVVEVVHELNTRGIRPYVLMDVTGVGRPVFDALHGALWNEDCALQAVTFTGGEELHGSLGSTNVSMPKSYMVSRLQALLQVDRLKLPYGDKGAQALAEELATYEIRVSENANLQAGAFRTGAHDDLATALGLACLFDPTAAMITYGPEIFDGSNVW